MSKKKRKPVQRRKPAVSGWSITWQGKTWTDADLTGQHLAQLALLSGDDRFERLVIKEDEIRAYPSLGFMRLLNMLSALVSVDVANEYDDADEVAAALKEIQQASAEDIIGAVTFR